MSTSSSVCLLLAFMFLKFYSASFWRCECKWLIFFASDVSARLLSIAWKRSPNNSRFSILPSKISVFNVLGFNIVDDVWSRCWDTLPGTSFGKYVDQFAWIWVFSWCLINHWQCVVGRNVCCQVLRLSEMLWHRVLVSGKCCEKIRDNMLCGVMSSHHVLSVVSHSCHHVMSGSSPVIFNFSCREVAVFEFIEITSLIYFIWFNISTWLARGRPERSSFGFPPKFSSIQVLNYTIRSLSRQTYHQSYSQLNLRNYYIVHSCQIIVVHSIFDINKSVVYSTSDSVVSTSSYDLVLTSTFNNSLRIVLTPFGL